MRAQSPLAMQLQRAKIPGKPNNHFICLEGKKTSGESPEKRLTASPRAAGATPGSLVVQMVQIRAVLQPENMAGG